MSLISNLTVALSAKLGNWTPQLRQANADVEKLSGTVKKQSAQVSKSTGSMFSGITGMVGGLAASLGVLSAGAFVGWGVKIAAENEKAQVSFATMLGSAEKAKTLLGQIAKFAGETPFDTPELRESAQALLSFGVTAEKIMPMIKTLGDVASGSGSEIKDLALIYGKTLAKGKFELEQGNQLAERGIPIYSTLAKQLGVTQAELMKMISAGKVSAAQVKTAFETMSGAGGIFEDSMKKQSQTLLGAWAGFTDGIQMIAGDLGASLAKTFSFVDVVNTVSGATQSIRDGIAGLEPVLGAVRDIGTSAFGAIGEAAGMLWQAIKGYLEPVGNFLGGTFGNSLTAFRNNVLTVLYSAQWAIQNWQKIWQLSIDHATYGLVHFWEETKHIFGVWLPDVFNNLGTITSTFFGGWAENIANIVSEVWDYIVSFGEDPIEFDWTPVIAEELTRSWDRELSEGEKALLDEISRQQDELQLGLGEFVNGKMQEIESVGKQVEANVSLEGASVTADQEKTASGSTKRESIGALERGSVAAFSAIVKARQANDPMLTEAKKQTKAAEETAENTRKIASNPGLTPAPAI